MKKVSIFAICLILCLTGCEIDGDARPSAPVSPSLMQGVLSDDASATAKGEAREYKDIAAASSLDQVIELQSGIYGIPFSATIDEIMKWSADNHMAITNPTEEDVRENIKRALGRIRDLKEAYDLEVASLAPLEQELLKLAQGYADTGKIFEIAKIAAAQEKLDILKNPIVSYQGGKYYLSQVHKGLNVQVDGKEAICTDERITNTTFRLMLTPTEKSEKVLENGLEELDILFYRGTEEELRSYATFATLGDTHARSASAQSELILTAIREKYGTPVLIPRWRSNNDQRAYNLILTDMHNLLGLKCDISFFFENTAVAWASNLIILRYSRESAFQILYYDPKAADQIYGLYSEAIEQFKKDYYEKQKQALVQMKKDF